MEQMLQNAERKHMMVTKLWPVKFQVQLVSLRKQQALKEYTQCRTHEVNLTINFACGNQPIQKFMDNLTTICYYFDNSPKRQQYLQLLISFHVVKLQLHETKGKTWLAYLK